MSCHIFLAIYSFGLLVLIAKSDDLAVSNRLYNQLCNSYENSQYGRVLPGSSGSASVCPVIEKEESSNQWTFNTCGGNDGGSSNDARRGGKVRGLDKPGQPAPDDGDYYDDKIINGKDAIPYSHPYLVYLRTDFLEKGLSGTLYNSYTILVNTYHLEQNLKKAGSMDNLLIHIGKHKHEQRENEEQLRFMCNYTNHPKYTQGSKNSYYVYSAVHLYDPITFNNYADKIRLAKPSQKKTIEKTCLIPGWGSKGGGKETSSILQDADATIRDCVGNPTIDDNEFCTNPVYCWADSGSPLVCTDKHRIFATGLASATGRATGTDCKKAHDTLYADLEIQDVHDWAEKTFKDHEQMCRPLMRNEFS